MWCVECFQGHSADVPPLVVSLSGVGVEPMCARCHGIYIRIYIHKNFQDDLFVVV